MYEIRPTKAYRKAYKRVSKHKDIDLELLDEVIDKLASGKKLAAKHKDHQLTGELKEFRECHIHNDMLLVYKKIDDILVLVLVNIGSHSQLF